MGRPRSACLALLQRNTPTISDSDQGNSDQQGRSAKLRNEAKKSLIFSEKLSALAGPLTELGNLARRPGSQLNLALDARPAQLL
jgi:hypothetical protein